MINSKITEILKTFDTNELKEFGKFSKSPYFNNNKSIIKLYGFFVKYYPNFDKKSFTKENAYKFVFPNKSYNDGTMRKLLSEIQSLAEEFLTYVSIKKNFDFQKRLALLYQLSEKKLDRLFELNVCEFDKTLKELENFDDEYFKNNFDLEVAKLNFKNARGRAGFDFKSISIDLQKCANYLICYTLIMSFKLNQDLFVTGVSTDFDKTNTLVYKFIESLGPNKFLEILKSFTPEYYPVIAIYFNRFMISAGYDDDDKYYWQLKDLILQNIGLFTRFEKYNLLLFLENSCDEKIYANKNFNKELHNIHIIMLSTGLYVANENDHLSLVRFRKIIIDAISINEIKWVEEFIGNYLDKLPEEFRSNMYYYTQALLNFCKANFEKTLENISKVKSDVYTVKFDVWTLKLQCEFELKYLEEAYYSIDSYKHSLKSDTTSPQLMKNRFLTFLNFYNNLLKLSINSEDLKKNTTSLEILRNDVLKSSELLKKKWLLEKLQDIIK
jgi:hypothetical protein